MIAAVYKPMTEPGGAKNYLAPLAGRGRKPRAVRLPGEGQLPALLFGAVRVAKTPLTPTLSPQAGRGSVAPP